MELWQYLLLTLAGAVAGTLNVIAGGGSLISMPILIFLGLPPATANGTNRVAILIQNVSAVTTFHRRGLTAYRHGPTLGLATVPGAVLGAVAAVHIDPVLFKRILAGVLVAALALMVAGRKPRGDRPAAEDGHPVLAHLAFVAIGLYGGFMQAGVGFIIMPVLHRLLSLDLVRVNVHKVLIIGIYMVPTLALFAFEGHVAWLAGVALAAGNATGGWLGARISVSRGEGLIRAVFALAVVAMAVKLAVG